MYLLLRDNISVSAFQLLAENLDKHDLIWLYTENMLLVEDIAVKQLHTIEISSEKQIKYFLCLSMTAHPALQAPVCFWDWAAVCKTWDYG